MKEQLKRILDRLVWGDEPGDKELVAWASAEILKLVEKAEQEARVGELNEVMAEYWHPEFCAKKGKQYRACVACWAEARLSELREKL